MGIGLVMIGVTWFSPLEWNDVQYTSAGMSACGRYTQQRTSGDMHLAGERQEHDSLHTYNTPEKIR